MKRYFALFTLISTAAFADSLRSDKHFVKIEAQPAVATSRQFNVQVFDAESHKDLAHLKVSTSGNAPAEGETNANGMRYVVRIEPHGASYLAAFTAYDGTGPVDAMRGGFTQRSAGADRPAAPPARAGREVAEPAVLRRVEPVYTEEAKAVGAAGTVVLEVRIDKSGFVQDVTVLKPMGHGLTESAVDAVKQWRFAPSMKDRVPVEVVQEVTIEFKP